MSESHERRTFQGERGEQGSTRLDELYPSFKVGESAPGREELARPVEAYELIIDAADPRERQELLVGFCLRAAALGYQEAFPSVSVGNIGYRDPNGERPLTAIYFFLRQPNPVS